MSYQLLIFDWDGTLIDSTGRIVSSFQSAAAELGMRVPPDEDVRNIIGLGLKEAIEEVMPELELAEVDALAQAYSRHYLEVDKTPTALFESVETGLNQLRQSGFRLAVATGKSRRGLDRVMSATGLGELFEITRCADEARSKPDPLMLHQILQSSGVSADTALMVGDTDYDVNMATNAGVTSVAVTYGAHDRARLDRAAPTHSVDSFVEFLDWILNR